MKDRGRTREQLINELMELRQRIVELEASVTERRRAEEALRESEERYRRLVELSPDAIAVHSEGKIVFVNSAGAKLLGAANPAQLIGKPILDILHPDYRETVKERLRQMREEGKGTPLIEEKFIRLDGTVVDVEVAGIPITYQNKPAVQVVIRDITKRKRRERLLRALNRAALAIEQTLTPEEIFATVAKELKKLGFSCVVFLTDESQSRLFVKHWSYESGAIKFLEDLVGFKIEDFSISIETADIYRKVVRERKGVFIENVEEITRQFLPEPLKKFTGQIVRVLKIKKSIPTPLIVEDEVIGLLSVESNDLTEDDIPAITAFAHLMAAAWRKTNLLQDLKRSVIQLKQAEKEVRQSFQQLRRALEGAVYALASTAERRDPYTAGHQQRVTQLACAIAQEMELPEEQIEGIRVTGTLHDIGKIYVPAEILNKPGRLTETEMTLIKTHPQVGYDILKTIEFPWPVAQIVLQHQERMDGSGYPEGLSGEEILLEARILAVADVVEAMSSHRPYRPALGTDKALKEISQNRDILYDPNVVDACLRLFAENGFKFE